MRRQRFAITFVLLLILQILLMNFGNFSQLLSVFFLPVMILCLPVEQSTVVRMLIAFAVGFAADFFASGILGLTSFALVSVAAARNSLVKLVYGQEMFARGEDISPAKQGLLKLILCTFIVTGLFLALYIWADGAGMRSFGFSLTKWLVSTAADTAVSIYVGVILTSEGSIWR